MVVRLLPGETMSPCDSIMDAASYLQALSCIELRFVACSRSAFMRDKRCADPVGSRSLPEASAPSASRRVMDSGRSQDSSARGTRCPSQPVVEHNRHQALGQQLTCEPMPRLSSGGGRLSPPPSESDGDKVKEVGGRLRSANAQKGETRKRRARKAVVHARPGQLMTDARVIAFGLCLP